VLYIHGFRFDQGGKPRLKVTDRSPRNQTALRARCAQSNKPKFLFALRANSCSLLRALFILHYSTEPFDAFGCPYYISDAVFVADHFLKSSSLCWL